MKTAYDYVLDAYKNPNGDSHKEIIFYSKILFGIQHGTPDLIEKSKFNRQGIWHSEVNIFEKGLKFDLGICPLSFQDLKIYAESDSVSEANTFMYGFYDELNYLYVAQSLLKPNDTVIDVGANIGCNSLAYSRMVSDGLVYSFEPNDFSIKKFKKNCILNKVKNVKLYTELLSDKETECHFNEDNNNFNKGVGRVEDKGTKIIKSKTLDSFLDEFKGNIGLLKIDVEGHELKVLSGARKLLEIHKPFIFVEYNKNDWSVEELKRVIPYKYTLQKLPYTFYEELVDVDETTNLDGFVNFLISPMEEK